MMIMHLPVKRLYQFVVSILFITQFAVATAQIYVSPNGNDSYEGSKNYPKASLQAALRQVRELRRLKDERTNAPIHIIIEEGVYHLQAPVVIRPEDAGTAQSPTYIEAANGAKAVLSGGIALNGWKKVDTPIPNLPTAALSNIWEASLPEILHEAPAFRQLWIDESKATRAKWPNGNGMERIISWNKKDESCQIPRPPINISQVDGVEMFIHQWWEIANLRIKQINYSGDSSRLQFKQPESRIQSEHPWPAPWLSEETGNSAFFLTNAIEFLDEPGEWYVDKKEKKIYYWPLPNQNLSVAKTVLPFLENIISITGTINEPVAFLHFKNIAFEHVGWNRPSLQGHVPHQAGMPMTEAYKLKPSGTKEKPSLDNQAWIVRPGAAVSASFAHNIYFEDCSFKHTASTALDFSQGVKNSNVNGCVLKDIGGTAILAGYFGDNGAEIHLPYNPKDERVMVDSISITNNLITNATNEDWGCVGIGLGYTRNSFVAHNEIENVNYSGISMGWGWSPQPNMMCNNRITANKIHHFGKQNYDCAGVYTLSAQPASIISENVIDSIYKAPYAHLPTHWFYLYTDEGSSYITIKNNWTASQKYLQNNNGPGNQWVNNGPQVSSKIKMNAGLQNNYKYLLKESTYQQNKQALNTEHEELIELIVTGKALNVRMLRQFLIENNVNPDCIYQWKNHYVIFDKIQDLSVFQSKIKKAFPQLIVKPYYDMYYQFDRSKCADTTTAQEWEHVLLTANLVPDKEKQKAYLNHHATQFEKWPEISKGFCNANFQRLLMFRNGRQLMLIISIPKGKTLDELNPKTTENNPRVIEWNKLMAQYQQGITGTKKGEVWVLLKKIHNL